MSGRLLWIVPVVTMAAAVALCADFVWFLARIDAGIHEAPMPHAEGAVALTGGADRIAEAVELLAHGDADRLLITGVNPLTSRAHLARRTPQSEALFQCCIELGYAAANTVGNAEETERWARAHRIRTLIVVTSNYHMPRALAEIGSVLPDVRLIAYPVVAERDKEHPWWEEGQRARLVIVEYLKYVAAQWRLRLAPPRVDHPREAAVD